MTINQIIRKLEDLLPKKRFVHSINVMNSSIYLAKKYGEDTKKAELAGLLHDCARYIKGNEIFNQCNKYNIVIDDISKIQPDLLHGLIGAKHAEEYFGVKDNSILNAICNHTLGRENMSKLEKIIFVADYIEPGRKFAGVKDIRKEADLNLDKAVIKGYDSTFIYCIKKGNIIHPSAVYARNYILNTLNNCDRIV